MTKILAIVNFNGGEALVLNRKPNLKYTKYDGHTIVGTDGLFCQFYKYAPGSGNFKAFAGREFDLPLTDGTVEHCSGQWWADMTPKAYDVIGEPIEPVTACDKESLQDLYIFKGYHAKTAGLKILRDAYTGRTYGYDEYCRMLKNREV